ncbi:hypothetical protein [Streptomyces sp. NPDC054834]
MGFSPAGRRSAPCPVNGRGVRTEYVTTLTLPADLCAGLGTDWINALATAQGLEATA